MKDYVPSSVSPMGSVCQGERETNSKLVGSIRSFDVSGGVVHENLEQKQLGHVDVTEWMEEQTPELVILGQVRA